MTFAHRMKQGAIGEGIAFDAGVRPASPQEDMELKIDGWYRLDKRDLPVRIKYAASWNGLDFRTDASEVPRDRVHRAVRLWIYSHVTAICWDSRLLELADSEPTIAASGSGRPFRLYAHTEAIHLLEPGVQPLRTALKFPWRYGCKA